MNECNPTMMNELSPVRTERTHESRASHFESLKFRSNQDTSTADKVPNSKRVNVSFGSHDQ
jgi:hypothetical protein